MFPATKSALSPTMHSGLYLFQPRNRQHRENTARQMARPVSLNPGITPHHFAPRSTQLPIGTLANRDARRLLIDASDTVIVVHLAPVGRIIPAIRIASLVGRSTLQTRPIDIDDITALSLVIGEGPPR